MRRKRTVTLSCIPASHAKMRRPLITRHRNQYTANTPHQLNPSCNKSTIQSTLLRFRLYYILSFWKNSFLFSWTQTFLLVCFTISGNNNLRSETKRMFTVHNHQLLKIHTRKCRLWMNVLCSNEWTYCVRNLF